MSSVLEGLGRSEFTHFTNFSLLFSDPRSRDLPQKKGTGVFRVRYSLVKYLNDDPVEVRFL